jgi:hypothetical protein
VNLTRTEGVDRDGLTEVCAGCAFHFGTMLVQGRTHENRCA